MPETFLGWIVYLIEEYYPLFLRGVGVTLFLSISGTIIGFVLGLLVSIVKAVPIKQKDTLIKKIILKIANAILSIYVEVFRGTPMMVQAMIIYYGSLQYLGLDMSPMFAGIIVISLNTGAYLAEVIRGGIISVDAGQTEGAMSIGMTHWQTMVHVVLPQAIRNVMPAIGNEFVINIKDSAVLSVIQVVELFFQTKSAAGTYFKYFEAFSITALTYLILTFTVTRILKLVEKKMDGKDSYKLESTTLNHKEGE